MYFLAPMEWSQSHEGHDVFEPISPNWETKDK